MEYDESTMSCWDCSTIRMNWKLMKLCISIRRWEVVGIECWMDMGRCSDRCKLYEVVGPFGKLVGIGFTRWSEMVMGRGSEGCDTKSGG